MVSTLMNAGSISKPKLGIEARTLLFADLDTQFLIHRLCQGVCSGEHMPTLV